MRRPVITLGVWLLLQGPLGAAEPDPLLPDDAEMVLTANIKQLADAPLVRTTLRDVPADLLATGESLPRLREAFGINPLTDVTSLWLAGPGSFAGDRWLLVLHGRFDAGRVQAAAATYGRTHPTTFQTHKQDRRTIYQFTGDSLPATGCLLDDTTFVLARTRPYLDEAIAKKDGNRKTALSKNMVGLLGQLDDKQTVGLAVWASPGFKKELATSPEMARLLAGVQHFRGGLTVGDGVQVDCLLQAGDAKTANELRQFAEAVKAILSLAAMDHKTHAPLLTTLVAAVKLTSSRDGVALRGGVTKEQVEKCLKAKPNPR